MMSDPHLFQVDTPLVALAVTVAGDAVTEIRLHAHAPDSPATPLERDVARELVEYANGRRTTFDFPLRPQGTPFEHSVWDELQRIPYGRTLTYGDIARRIGQPGAARAVGTANGRNPIPIAIPCHRVVAAGGKLGGYGGGLDLKRKLLALEGAHGPALDD